MLIRTQRRSKCGFVLTLGEFHQCVDDDVREFTRQIRHAVSFRMYLKVTVSPGAARAEEFTRSVNLQLLAARAA